MLRIRYGWSAPFAACALAAVGMLLLMACAHTQLAIADQPDDEPQRDNPTDPDTPLPDGSVARWSTIILLLTVTALWASCIGQSDGSLLLWARDHVRRGMLGFEVPASTFASVPALLALLLSPCLGLLKRFSATRSASSRITLGMWSTFLAMGLMALASIVTGSTPSNAAWLLGCFVLLIFGELLVAPLTQSILISLTPPRSHGSMLAASYGAIALGYGMAGALGTLWPRWPKPAFFGLLACVALCGTLLLRLDVQRKEAG